MWAVCWNPYREGIINALAWVQNKAAEFAHHRNDLNGETSAQHKKVPCVCALLIVFMAEQA
jgi:hypothetical protein